MFAFTLAHELGRCVLFSILFTSSTSIGRHDRQERAINLQRREPGKRAGHSSSTPQLRQEQGGGITALKVLIVRQASGSEQGLLEQEPQGDGTEEESAHQACLKHFLGGTDVRKLVRSTAPLAQSRKRL